VVSHCVAREVTGRSGVVGHDVASAVVAGLGMLRVVRRVLLGMETFGMTACKGCRVCRDSRPLCFATTYARAVKDKYRHFWGR
jgi:hypothetical protein